jgi:oxalate decarboxylase
MVLHAEGRGPDHRGEVGRIFADDVCEGDLWYFPPGIPRASRSAGRWNPRRSCRRRTPAGIRNHRLRCPIPGSNAHTPQAVLAKNFRTSEDKLEKLPSKGLYIFPAPKPGPLSVDRKNGAAPVPNTFSHRLLQQEPNRMAGGSVRIADSTNIPASKTIAAALVELEPGGLRELHWHPNSDEWQYYIEGEGRALCQPLAQPVARTDAARLGRGPSEDRPRGRCRTVDGEGARAAEMTSLRKDMEWTI